jgi:predicted RND superfamily exporter protein
MEKKRELGRALGGWLLNNRFIVILLSLLVVGVMGYGGKNITMSSDYRYFFGEDNPQRVAFENFQKVYAHDDSALIVIEHESGTVFNKTTLNAIKDLTDRAWKVPFSTRVNSLTNYQHTEAVEDDLAVRDLVGGVGTPELTPDYIQKIKEISRTEPLLVDNLVNPTGTITAVNVRVTLPQKSPDEVPEVSNYIREMVKKWEQDYPGHKVYLSGMAFMNNAFNEAAMNDMSTLIPLMYLVIIIIMAVLLKSVFSVINTFVVIVLSVVGAMGFAGWAGIPITPPSSIAPTVILTLGIADSIHLLKSIIGYMKKGLAKREAILEGLRVNLQPIFLTSLTTAIGFLSLNFSDTPPFHDLGNITAVGVLLAFGFSVTLLPVLVSIMPLKVEQVDAQKSNQYYKKLGAWIIKKKNPIILFTTALAIFLGLQIPTIKLNDQYVEYFDRSIQFRVDTDYVSTNLAGIYQINFDLKSGESQGIAKPEFLQHVSNFVEFSKGISGVTHVNAITDTFKRLNKNMHGDDPAYYKLPEQRDLAAQYLLLYEMSLPYGLDLNDQIDVDKSSTRVIVTLGNLDSTEFLRINDELEKWLVANTPKHMHVLGTSPAVMFSHISERNVKSMGWGTMLAFALISLVLVISLRSVKYGIVSLLPNMVPALLAFGVWGLFIGEAGFAIAIVTSVTLGVVVDDTVHFLSKYVRGKREKNLSAEDAVLEAFDSVGTALIATTVILTIGFSILMFSPFLMNWTLGALSALTIAIAFLVDFTFLPAVLITLDKSKDTAKVSKGGTMNLKNTMMSLLVIGLSIGLSNVVSANADPAKRGLEIAKLVDAHDQGWGNQVADVEMILRNKQGQESKRVMKIKSLEVQGDGDKSLTIFKSPRDVKGSAFLSFTHPIGSDDQWLYLPALKRVKRISSHNKSGPFMGSEFAYEDISSQEVEKYTYKFIKNEKVNGVDGFQIERYPVDKNSGYTKQVVWIDSKEYLVHKVDYYDRKSTKLKTLEMQNFKKYLKSTWRPGVMKMINHQSGKSTDLVWKSYKFNNKLSSRDFDKKALKRVK